MTPKVQGIVMNWVVIWDKLENKNKHGVQFQFLSKKVMENMHLHHLYKHMTITCNFDKHDKLNIKIS